MAKGLNGESNVGELDVFRNPIDIKAGLLVGGEQLQEQICLFGFQGFLTGGYLREVTCVFGNVQCTFISTVRFPRNGT